MTTENLLLPYQSLCCETGV